MLPDRAKFYDSLKNYNSLQHAKQNSMYGLEYDEHSYYKREGEPGNYRYYWTKQEYEAHLAELEKQRNKNMQAGQNYEADRWKKNDQNKMKNQQIKNNSQANAEADRWKRQEEQRKQQEQDKKWQQQQEDAKKRVAESARQKMIDKNQGNDGESERWKRYEAQKLREKQIKDAQERTKQREIAKKNEGNNPEADRWKRQQEQEDSERKAERAEAARKDQEAKEASIKKATDNSLKYNKEVDEIREATQRLQENENMSQEEYNKGKTERQNKLKESKEDLFDMTNYYRKKNGNEDFDKAFEEAKKSAGVENLYIHGGDIKYYDKELEDKISDMKSKMSELGRKNGELESRNSDSNVDSKTKASNENQYQTNLNEIRELEREIEVTESKMKQKAYSAYEQVLDQMYSAKESGQSLQTARERKQLEHEQWVKEQEGDWLDKVKKKAKKIFS